MPARGKGTITRGSAGDGDAEGSGQQSSPQVLRGQWANVVRSLPDLPIPLQLANISIQYSFEGYPSASIQYEGILERDIPKFESAYDAMRLNRTKLNIYGIPYAVATYEYSRDRYSHRTIGNFDIFNASVELEWYFQFHCEQDIRVGKILKGKKSASIKTIASIAGVGYRGPNPKVVFAEDDQEIDPDTEVTLSGILGEFHRINGCYLRYRTGVEMVKLNSGRSWHFPDSEIISDGGNSISQNPYWNEASISWDFEPEGEKDDVDDEEEGEEGAGKQFKQKEPIFYTLIEEDEKVESPPANSKVLRELSSNAHQSGPKKVRKITDYMDGTPLREKTEIYGFAYTWEDVHVGDGQIFAKASDWWRKIEEMEVIHLYVSATAQPVVIRINTPPEIRSTIAGRSRYYEVLLHPDYEQFAGFSRSISISQVTGMLTFKKSAADFFIGTDSDGWRWIPMADETDGSNTLYPEDPMYPHYKFRRVGKKEKSRQLLVSQRSLYGGGDSAQPFSIEWSEWDSLAPYLKKALGGKISVFGERGRSALTIGLIAPDPNYVEPMCVKAETSQTNSFRMEPHPEYAPDNPMQPLITGEEGYQQTIRNILIQRDDLNIYQEKRISMTSQDPGFTRAAEVVQYADVEGQFPGATSRQRPWEEQEKDPSAPEKRRNNDRLGEKQKKEPRYYITSDWVPADATPGGSVSYPRAKTQGQAKIGALTDIIIQTIQTHKASKTIAWFYPQLRDGDFVSLGADRFSRFGRWRVLGASFEIQVDASRNRVGLNPIALTEGLQLELGLQMPRQVSISKDMVPLPADEGEPPAPPGNNGGQPGAELADSAFNLVLGGMLPRSPGRRQ